MKQSVRIILLLAFIIVTISYASDSVDLFIYNKYYEGYIFAIKILLFDVVVLIPLILAFNLQKESKFKAWAFVGILAQNLVLILGFKVGAIVGIISGLISITYFALNFKKMTS